MVANKSEADGIALIVKQQFEDSQYTHEQMLRVRDDTEAGSFALYDAYLKRYIELTKAYKDMLVKYETVRSAEEQLMEKPKRTGRKAKEKLPPLEEWESAK